MLWFDKLQHHLEPLGLTIRGGFAFTNREPLKAPLLEGGKPAKTLLLIGNLGGDFWSSFASSGFEGHDALDRWTKHVLNPIAESFGGEALHPNDRPIHPFLRWAERAEGMKPSPLGLLIHPQYGLWHAYRAAFVFADEKTVPQKPEWNHPCEACEEKPCLTSCPVMAFTPGYYDVALCVGHVRGDAKKHCATSGCLARQACPVGKGHEYSKAQQQFHMNAFVGGR